MIHSMLSVAALRRREGGATLLSTGSQESWVGFRQPEIRRIELCSWVMYVVMYVYSLRNDWKFTADVRYPAVSFFHFDTHTRAGSALASLDRYYACCLRPLHAVRIRQQIYHPLQQIT